jgi:hypothetical protein
MLEPLAHFDNPEIESIHGACFGVTTRKTSVSTRIQEIKDRLKSKLYEFCGHFDIDLLIPENSLAIPMNIPLGIAITEYVAETDIPAIAHHHDFSWERNRFLINGVRDILHYAFPPVLNSIRHVVINTEASRQLSYRRGISTVIIPNVFDFESPSTQSPNGTKLRQELGLGNQDLFVLQPTRVVPRKWIERAVELVSLLELENPRLVVSHESGDEGDLYAKRILEYAQRLGVKVIYTGDKIGSAHCFKAFGDKDYTMDDVYHASDLVIVVNRYSIYVEDIEPCGFNVIPFEGFVTKEIVDRVKQFMDPRHLETLVEKNYALGTKHFSYKVLEKKLLSIIETFY